MLSEEVCVLSAAGTAAIVKLQPTDADVKETEHKRDANRVDVIQSWNFLGMQLFFFQMSNLFIGASQNRFRNNPGR